MEEPAEKIQVDADFFFDRLCGQHIADRGHGREHPGRRKGAVGVLAFTELSLGLAERKVECLD
jgi:hypothetical protein